MKLLKQLLLLMLVRRSFNWWAHKVLKQRDRMIKQMKAQRCCKGRMKFGVQIPGTVEEAIELDRANGNTLWQDAIKLEMKNSRVAFQLKERGEKAPAGHTQITCHLIFDLKLDMTRKARYVAGGHLTDVPTYMTYSSVVSRDCATNFVCLESQLSVPQQFSVIMNLYTIMLPLLNRLSRRNITQSASIAFVNVLQQQYWLLTKFIQTSISLIS